MKSILPVATRYVLNEYLIISIIVNINPSCNVIINVYNIASELLIDTLQYAESRIRDTDIAKAMVEFSKASILEQVGQAMLSQARNNAESVLTLLQ